MALITDLALITNLWISPWLVAVFCRAYSSCLGGLITDCVDSSPYKLKSEGAPGGIQWISIIFQPMKFQFLTTSWRIFLELLKIHMIGLLVRSFLKRFLVDCIKFNLFFKNINSRAFRQLMIALMLPTNCRIGSTS